MFKVKSMHLIKFFSSVLLTAFLLCLLSSITFAQESTRPPQTARASIRTENFAYKLSDDDFVNTPSWNQEDEPPLSLSRAVKIARENMPRFVKMPEIMKVSDVTLQRMGQDKWYYRVRFSCFGGQCRDLEVRSFVAVVKMDGTFIDPKKIKIEN
jgi:hypothetical protein